MFALNRLFSGLGYSIVSFKFLPWRPLLPCNEFWDKIHYNSVCVRDTCKIFTFIVEFSGMGHLAHSFKIYYIFLVHKLAYWRVR